MKSWEIDLMMLRSELIFREYAERTQEIYINTVRDFLQEIDKDSCNIQREDVMRYLDKRAEKDSRNTVLVRLNALEFFFEEVLGLDITNNLRKYKREYKKNLISLDEIEILIASVPGRDKMIYKTILETGEYPSGMYKWKVSDLISKEGEWYLGEHKLSKDYTRDLLEYIQKNEKKEYLFSAYNEHIDYTNIYAALRKHTETYLGRKVSFSEMKHAVALEMFRQGKKEEGMEYIGNKNFSSIKQWYKMRGIIIKNQKGLDS